MPDDKTIQIANQATYCQHYGACTLMVGHDGPCLNDSGEPIEQPDTAGGAAVLSLAVRQLVPHPSQHVAQTAATRVEAHVQTLRAELDMRLNIIDGLVTLRYATNAQIKEERDAVTRLRRMIAASKPPKKGGDDHGE